jgi:hypothetical protein
MTAEGRPDPVGGYLDTLRGLEARERNVVGMVATVQQAARALEHWQAVYVEHSGFGFPKEVTMAGRAIDASTWPTAQQLADTLAAWQEAAEAARTAWARLPREMRSGMPPPP